MNTLFDSINNIDPNDIFSTPFDNHDSISNEPFLSDNLQASLLKHNTWLNSINPDTYYDSFFDFLDFPDLSTTHEKQTVSSQSALAPQPNESIFTGPLILMTTPSRSNTHSLNKNTVTENTASRSTEAFTSCPGRSNKDPSDPIEITFKINIKDAPFEHPVFTEAEKMDGRKIFLFKVISRKTSSDGTTLTEVSRRPYEHPMDSVIGKRERASPLAISCIWWQEKDQYLVTSCDILRIVEGLIGVVLNRQQKTRMRRQLQSYFPMTMGKKRSEETNAFYLQLVSFKAPSVKTYDKGIKMFRWEILEEALVKLVDQLKF